jgi:hypothetical protein
LQWPDGLTVFQASLESERSRGYVPGHALANRYELRRLLGEGGTGVVWVACDRVLNLEVAVKLVRASATDGEDFARQAQTEARSAARLAHPAVCRAMDFGLSAQGEPFIVSELLDGESLDDTLAREGRLEATRAVRILLPILDALHTAHESGIVHRDVKPANVFLARDGRQRVQPKLLDFGIARSAGDTRAASDAGICGTPEYMSPEQARGDDEIDGRSDLWNFCATLYEVLTGVVPFRGDTYRAVLCAVQSVDAEPITTFCAGDDELSAIVLRGLRRNPDRRWQSASELSAELCAWSLARGVETDICDHSLRARLVDHAGPDSGDRRLAYRSGIRRWKGVTIAVAIATVAVAAASVARSLRPDHEPFGHGLAAAALAPPRAGIIDPPPRTAVAPPIVPDDVSRPDESVQFAPVRAAPTVLPTRSFPVSVPPGPSATSTASAAPPVAARALPPMPVEQGPSPRPPRAPARRFPANALNYDFGF